MQTIKTSSKNTIAAYNYLKDNKSEAFTISEIASALGLTSAKVTGGLVSLAKKGVISKTDTERNDKPYKAFQFAEDVEFTMEDTKSMSDKAVQMIQFLQKQGDADMTAKDIASQLDMAAIGVNGVVNGLVKRDLATREEATFEMPDGEVRTLKLVKLTEDGKNYKF